MTLQNTEPTVKHKVIAAAIMVALFIFILKGCYSLFDAPAETAIKETPDILAKKHSKLDAYSVAQVYIKQQLKSPSTAEFSHDYENSVQKADDTTFIVKDYVDSQNSFGAMMRAEFVCVVYYTRDNVPHCNIMLFNQR